MKTIQESTERYVPPKAKVVKISTRAHILQSSLDGNPSVNDYRDGSDSVYGFGGDE